MAQGLHQISPPSGARRGPVLADTAYLIFLHIPACPPHSSSPKPDLPFSGKPLYLESIYDAGLSCGSLSPTGQGGPPGWHWVSHPHSLPACRNGSLWSPILKLLNLRFLNGRTGSSHPPPSFVGRRKQARHRSSTQKVPRAGEVTGRPPQQPGRPERCQPPPRRSGDGICVPRSPAGKKDK